MHTLPNGLVVVLEEQHRSDTIAVEMRYRVGARDEEPGTTGTAHLFEHLMFEGSANVGNNVFDTKLTAAGGDNNAWTSEDETAYHEQFPSGALDLVLFLESDRLGFLDAGLDEANLKNQQGVVLQERAEGYEQPNGRDWDALTRLAWPEGHPYHHPVIGTVDDINGFQLDQVRSFWKTHYRPRNTVFVMVGHFEHDAALARIQHWFSDVPDTGPAPERVGVPDDLDWTPRRGLLEDQVEERSLYLSWRTVPSGHDDEPALDVLSYVLSDGRGTRLDDAIYYDKSLATEDWVYHGTGQLDSQLIIAAAHPKTKLAKLHKKIVKVVEGVADNPPTAQEMERAKKAMKGSYLDDLEDPAGRATLLVECLVRYGKPNCLEEEWARYEAVTAEDVARVVDTWLVPERLTTLSVVPEGDAKSALKGSGPVELP